MDRRCFFAIFLATAAQPAWAQPPEKRYRIAIVNTIGSAQDTARPKGGNFEAFFEELDRRGFIEGNNLVVERHSAEGRSDRYTELAREVVATNPDIILAISNGLVLRFKTATTTIPIIMTSSDPVAWGIVDNLARPEGNITGVTFDPGSEYYSKMFEYLRLAAPSILRIAYLFPHDLWQSNPITIQVHEAAEQIGVELVPALIDSPIDEAAVRRALGQAGHAHVDGLVVGPAHVIYGYGPAIVAWTRENGIPAIAPFGDFARQGGLMSYRADVREVFVHLAKQVDMALRGTKPGDIPVYQPNRFILRINLATVKALGINIPPTLLARADEVIE